MPWGLRIPLEISLAVGEPLFVKRCMGLLASTGAESGLRLFDSTGGVQVRRIRADDRDRFVALEVAAFGDDPATARAWLAPQFGVAGFDHWVAEIAGATVGSAASVRSDELAGPAVMITGMEQRREQMLDLVTGQRDHPGWWRVAGCGRSGRRPPGRRGRAWPGWFCLVLDTALAVAIVSVTVLP